jgi:hypothetical protein
MSIFRETTTALVLVAFTGASPAFYSAASTAKLAGGVPA